ncbi:hypothetical protein SI65_09397 [Aspergillus cristatus]|uniref:Mid2 domain-containing protein n=1 Tax=Aspergillus cristatus TaxID=573508 RepID=A0A1E3B2N3_ASPCR|nr:hypothetical protein SI65_09397 [Aspergillus cristatus]
MNTGMATTTTTDTENAAGTRTTQPQAGTVWSIPGGISGPSPSPALLGTPSRPDVTTTTGNSSTSASAHSTTSITSFSTSTTSTLSSSEQTESASSSPDSNLNTSNSSSGSNKALIGGVVGGILALVIILAVIFVLFCGRKKKKRRFTLLAWHGPQHGHDREKGAVIAAAGIGSGESSQAGPASSNPIQPTPISTTLPTTTRTSTSSPTFNANTPNSATRLLRTPTLPSPAPSFTFPSSEQRHRHPLSPIPSIPSNSSLHSTLSSKHDMALGIEPDLGIHPALRGTNTETQTERTIETGTATNPETTPELGDTGFYRQRAELATYSQSELINIPPERRHPHFTASSPSPTSLPNSNSNSPTQTTRTSRSRTKIITPDGVLLSANFKRLSGCEDYATSFAQHFDGLRIQLVEEEVLPAYACDAIEGEGVRGDGGGVDEKVEGEGEGWGLDF